MGGPGVGDRTGDVRAQSPAVPVGDRVQLGRGLFAPRPFGRPVGGVEQRQRAAAGVLCGLRGRVVAQVGGEEGIRTGGPHVVEETVAGASGDRDGADLALRIAGRADALRGGGEAGRGVRRELGERHRVRQLADPAEPAAALGVARVRHQRAEDPQVQGARQGVGDAGVGGVGVGVRDVQGDVVLDQGVHDLALEGRGRDRRRTAQIERVVGDEEIGAELHRFVDDLLDRVDGEQHTADLGIGVAADRPDGIPPFGPLGGQRASSAVRTSDSTGTEGRLPPRCDRERGPGRGGPLPAPPGAGEAPYATPGRVGCTRPGPPSKPPPQPPNPPPANRAFATLMREVRQLALIGRKYEN